MISRADFLLLARLRLLHHVILLSAHLQHLLLAGLLQIATDEQLVQDVVGFVEVKDDVQLADVAEVAVEHLDEQMDHLQRDELVVVSVDGGNEVQTRVPAEQQRGGSAGARQW